MFSKPVFFLVFLYLLPPAFAFSKEPPAKRGPDDVILGYVDKGSVFALDWVPVEGGRNHVTLLQASLNADPTRNIAAKKYDDYDLCMPFLPYRWRMAHGCYWGNGLSILLGAQMRRIPAEELYLFDSDDEEKRKQLFKEKYPEDVHGMDSHSWFPNPVGDVIKENMMNMDLEPLVRPETGVYFDVLPVAKDKLLLFVLWKGKMAIWRGEGKWSEKVGDFGHHHWEMTWSGISQKAPVPAFSTEPKYPPEETIKLDDKVTEEFHEPFIAFGGPDDFYFVTQSGRLFTSQKAEKGKRKVESLWNDPERPLGVVITETARNKSFGFARADKGGQSKEKPVYFEFSGKLDPQAYDPKKFESLKAEEPLKTVMEHARFLWKEKKIKE